MASLVNVTSGSGFVSIQIRPPVEFIANQFGAFADRLRNLDELFVRFVPVLSDIERDQFSTHGHGDWPPLSPATLAEKERMGYPADPLVRTSELRDSLVDPAAAAEFGHNRLTWKTTVPHAGYHQQGSERLPRRQVISDPFRLEDRRRLETVVVGWINDVAAETFGRR